MKESRSNLWRAIAALGAVVLVAGGAVTNLPSASAESTAFYVNTTSFNIGQDGDCAPGADVYTGTAADTCSLGAALTAANLAGAQASATDPVLVTLAADFAASIPDGTQQIITPDATDSNFMGPLGMNSFVGGGSMYTPTYYLIRDNVTLDLQNKLGIVTDTSATAIVIIGHDIQLLNASNIRTGSTSIVVWGSSDTVLIQGGSTTQASGPGLMQWLVIATGSKNITVRDYTVANGTQGNNTKCNSAAICLGSGTGTDPRTTLENVMIDNVRVCSNREGSTIKECDRAHINNLSPNAIVFNDNQTAHTPISGLTIQNSTFDNLYASQPVVSFGTITREVADFLFTSNTVTNSGPTTTSCPSAVSCSAIYLPYNSAMKGTNRISDNTFATDTSHPVAHAIGNYGGNALTGTSIAASNLWITNNSFDGYKYSAIHLDRAGIATVAENTFGNNQSSQSNTTTEETTIGLTTQAMLVNQATTSNNKIRTWYPDPEAPAVSSTCVASFTVRAPTANVPTPPVRLDVYWTQTTKAEKFVGSFMPYSTSPASVTVNLPPEAIGTDGKVTGGLRLQTHRLVDGQPRESSQYSRVVALPKDTCSPSMIGELTIDKRAWTGAESLSYGQIIDDGLATEVEADSILPPGTRVTWTYTVLYSNDDTSLTGQPGPADVVVTDDKITQTCVIPQLQINIPSGCVLSGNV